MVLFLEKIFMAKITRNKNGELIECNNLTLLNLILVYFGPMKEGNLAICVMLLQIFASLLAFALRYGLPLFFYPKDAQLS